MDEASASLWRMKRSATADAKHFAAPFSVNAEKHACESCSMPIETGP
jgi:hypothetical protein